MAEPNGPTRIAMVTGAGSGIGRAVSLALLRVGWSVALLGRRMDRLRDTAKLADAGARALPLVADVGIETQVVAAFEDMRAAFGRLDFLFNNAGAFAPALPVEDITAAQWSEVVNANLTGTFFCAREAFRLMKAQTPQGGRILNNGSISAQVPRPHSAPYTATKHAVTGLTKSLALDGRAFDIAVGQIDIGNAATDMTQGFSAGAAQADGSIRMEPRMSVDHVVEAVMYIADLPLAVNVPFLTVMANGMPFMGRG